MTDEPLYRIIYTGPTADIRGMHAQTWADTLMRLGALHRRMRAGGCRWLPGYGVQVERV